MKYVYSLKVATTFSFVNYIFFSHIEKNQLLGENLRENFTNLYKPLGKAQVF